MLKSVKGGGIPISFDSSSCKSQNSVHCIHLPLVNNDALRIADSLAQLNDSINFFNSAILCLVVWKYFLPKPQDNFKNPLFLFYEPLFTLIKLLISLSLYKTVSIFTASLNRNVSFSLCSLRIKSLGYFCTNRIIDEKISDE